MVLLSNIKELPFAGVGFFPLSKLRSGQYTDTTGHKDDHNGVIAADSQLDVCRRLSRASKATGGGGGTLGRPLSYREAPSAQEQNPSGGK